MTAWKQLVEVLCTRNFPLLNAAMSGGGAVLLQETLRLLLNQLKALSARKVPGLVEQLAGSCRVLLGKLQELAAGGLVAGVAADGVSQVRPAPGEAPPHGLQLCQNLHVCLHQHVVGLGRGQHCRHT